MTVRAASESSGGMLIAHFCKHKQGLMVCAVLGDEMFPRISRAAVGHPMAEAGRAVQH